MPAPPSWRSASARISCSPSATRSSTSRNLAATLHASGGRGGRARGRETPDPRPASSAKGPVRPSFLSRRLGLEPRRTRPATSCGREALDHTPQALAIGRVASQPRRDRGRMGDHDGGVGRARTFGAIRSGRRRGGPATSISAPRLIAGSARPRTSSVPWNRVCSTNCALSELCALGSAADRACKVTRFMRGSQSGKHSGSKN